MHLRQPEEALASFDSALQVEPNSAEAHAERARALMALGRMEEALGAYDTALLGMPDATDTLYNRGVALLKMQRTQDALASFEKVLKSDPGHIAALTNRGNALFELGRVDEALASFDKALARKGKYAEALNSRAASREARPPRRSRGGLREGNGGRARRCKLLDQPRHDPAAAGATRGGRLRTTRPHSKIDGGYKYGLGRLVERPFACDWTGFAGLVDRLAADARAGKLATNPFTMLTVNSEPGEQRACAQAFAADKYPKVPNPLYQGAGYGPEPDSRRLYRRRISRAGDVIPYCRAFRAPRQEQIRDVCCLNRSERS